MNDISTGLFAGNKHIPHKAALRIANAQNVVRPVETNMNFIVFLTNIIRRRMNLRAE